jgi:SAM-dependent methyltransferase
MIGARLLTYGARMLSSDGRRLIVDRERRLNANPAAQCSVDTTINKEREARAIIFSDQTPGGPFCDFGSGEADLNYLLAIDGNFAPDPAERENRARFAAKFQYWGIELAGDPANNVIAGDLCSPTLATDNPSLASRFAVVYSNNVFEHLRRPWVAAKNVVDLLMPRGVAIIIVPFSQRYHESPSDYFRYTHAGVESLFVDQGRVEIIRAGYDILGRRNDWQGSGKANDVVPEDHFGAWRENWFTFVALRKVR